MAISITLSFTSSDWSTAQTVTVVAPQDDDGFSNTGTITHTVSGGGLGASANLSTTVTDDDPVELVVGGNATYNEGGGFYAMSVTEGTDSGANNQFTVKLASQPYPSTENVTFTMNAPADSGLTFKKQGETTGSAMLSLTFTGDNWDTAQTVTVGAGHDDDTSDVKHTLAIRLSGANYVNPSDDFDFVIDDDDSPGLVISDSVIEINETDAVVTETYTVKLLTKPSADVTVTLTQPANTDVTVDPTTLTFTSTTWNTTQTVTVSVAADADAGNESATIVHSVSQTGGDGEYGALGDSTVSVTIDDDEVAMVVPGTATTTLTEPDSGTATSTYKITLSTPPTTDVTVALAVVGLEPAVVGGESWTNPDVTVDPTSAMLTSSNWNTGVTITVRVAPDEDGENDRVRIDHAVSHMSGAQEYSGVSAASVDVRVTDSDTPQVEFRLGSSGNFSANPALSGDEGGTAMYSARLTTRPRGTVNLNVTAPSGFVVTPSPLTFMPSEWSSTLAKEFTVTIPSDDNSFNEMVTFNHSVAGYGRGDGGESGIHRH